MKQVGRGRPRSYRMTAEAKKRISVSKLGVARTQETKDKISVGMKEMWRSLKERAGELEATNKKLKRELNDRKEQ